MLFAGHETFYIRDGWLHKGIKAVSEDPMIFANQFATDQLGVGRNMVNAIRYWLVAAGLAHETKEKIDNKPKPRLDLTEFGKLVLKCDPFFEEDATLWSVHYNLATNREKSTAWYWFFNKFPITRFDAQTCVNYLSRWITQEAAAKKVALPSLQKDINCVVRTYIAQEMKNRKSSPEDTFECPLSSLQLIDFFENTNSFRANVKARRIPPGALAYAIAKYLETQGDDIVEAGFQELLSAENSPGRIFLLSSDGLLEALDVLQEYFGKRRFSFSRTAGLNVLRVKREPALNFLQEALTERANIQ